MPEDQHVSVFRDTVKGLETGFLLGPFAPTDDRVKNVTISPLQIVVKLNKKPRVVHNLSFGKRNNTSVNSFISECDRSVSYNTFRSIVSFLSGIGSGGFLFVSDMFEAYRRVLVCPKFHKFLAFRWYNKIYKYACLPFGLASACKIYSEFSELLRKIVVSSDKELWSCNGLECLYNYLDDFWGAHCDEASAWEQFISFLEWLDVLGVPTQWSKCSPPCGYQVLLGFLFDLRAQSVCIPELKVETICDQIDELIANQNRTKRDVASVRGVLTWASQVIQRSRSFLRSLDIVLVRPMWM